MLPMTSSAPNCGSCGERPLNIFNNIQACARDSERRRLEGRRSDMMSFGKQRYRYAASGAVWASRTVALAFLVFGTASAAERDANIFSQKVYAVTKAGNYQAYQQLMHPRCHASAVTPNSFAPPILMASTLATASAGSGKPVVRQNWIGF